MTVIPETELDLFFTLEKKKYTSLLHKRGRLNVNYLLCMFNLILIYL